MVKAVGFLLLLVVLPLLLLLFVFRMVVALVIAAALLFNCSLLLLKKSNLFLSFSLFFAFCSVSYSKTKENIFLLVVSSSSNLTKIND